MEPKRCLTARRSRRAWWRSPSKASTVSTTCSSTRGPARPPSLVTWPTSTTATPRALASCTRRWAHSRTCTTEPGAEASSGSTTVWMESITTTSGCTASRRGDDVGQHRLGQRATARGGGRRAARPGPAPAARPPRPRRRGRAARRPASAAAMASSRVDLPTPGSPPSRVTDPGTRPPPSTRSSSARPVGTGRAPPPSTAVMGAGRAGGAEPAGEPPRRPAAGRRPRAPRRGVFHASHDGHRPVQRGALPPHSVHRWTVFTFAMGRPYGRGVTELGTRSTVPACARTEDRRAPPIARPRSGCGSSPSTTPRRSRSSRGASGPSRSARRCSPSCWPTAPACT